MGAFISLMSKLSSEKSEASLSILLDNLKNRSEVQFQVFQNSVTGGMVELWTLFSFCYILD